MTPIQIDIVQRSFSQVQPIARQAAAMFYERLFELDPQLRPLFKGDLAAQGQMLMSMIGAAVTGLRDLPRLAPVLRSMGARHAGYGVKDAHYATVGAALIWTLDKGLGAAFTRDVRDAWVAAYGLLSQTMMAGAAEAVAS